MSKWFELCKNLIRKVAKSTSDAKKKQKKTQIGLNQIQNVLKEHCHKGEQTAGRMGEISANLCSKQFVSRSIKSIYNSILKETWL